MDSDLSLRFQRVSIGSNTNCISYFLLVVEEGHKPGTVIKIGDEQLRRDLQVSSNMYIDHVQYMIISIQNEVFKSYLCKCKLCKKNDVVFDMPMAKRKFFKFILYRGNYRERIERLKEMLDDCDKYFSEFGSNKILTFMPWVEGKSDI